MVTTFRRTSALLASVALVVTGCGGGGDEKTSSAAPGNGVDRAFSTEMISHHKMAIDMAQMAQMDADHAAVKSLAGDIVKAQQSEITKLRSIDGELKAAGVEAGDIGVAEKDRGMDMKMSDLDGASPFDQHFIDMMVPHHEGAIAMAQAELKKGENAQLKSIAQAIVKAQTSEIAQMKEWRKMWYGSSEMSHDDM